MGYPSKKGKGKAATSAASADQEDGPSDDDQSSHHSDKPTQQQLAEMINSAVETAMSRALQRIPSLSPSPAPPPAPTHSLPSSSSSSRLRPSDIGYFDPESKDITGKTPTYSDVFAFTDMLLHLAETQADEIRTAFPLCLRGTALFWYSTELTSLERRLLSSAPVAELCNSLTKRFRERPGVALRSLISARFGFNDIRLGKTMRTHVQEMLRFSRSAGFESEFNTLLLIHNSLDTSLRGHIDEPDESTTLSVFLAAADAKWSLWLDMAHRPAWKPPNNRLLPDIPEQQVVPGPSNNTSKPAYKSRAYPVDYDGTGPSPSNRWIMAQADKQEEGWERLNGEG